MSAARSLRQALVRLARQRMAFVLIVVSLGATLGALICAIQFTALVSWQPLPYPDQDRLVVAEQLIFDQGGNPQSRDFSYPAIALLHDEAKEAFESAVMLDHARDVLVSQPDQPLVNVSYTSGEYASLFAPQMARGHFPGSNDYLNGALPLAVISYSAWQSLFGRREDVIGMRMRTAAGIDFEVVGVTARRFVEPAFRGPGQRTELWLPWDFNPSPRHWGWAATTDTLTFVGRLAPALAASSASTRLSEVFSARWQDAVDPASSAQQGGSTRIELTAAQQAIAGDSDHVGALLSAGTLGLLLVTLVNIIHLLLARVAERSREFSIQRALGANDTHLFGQVLADMLLLMLPVTAIALGVAAAGFALMRHTFGSMLARLDELAISGNAVTLTFAMALALALIFAGLALLAARWSTEAGAALNSCRQASTKVVPQRIRTMLMASQVGAAALLIALSVGVFREAIRVLGASEIALDRSASAFLYPSTEAAQDPARLQQLLGEFKRRLADLPGVEAVSQSHSPLQGFIKTAVVSERSRVQYPIGLKRIDQIYLGITGQSLALGRNFSAADTEQAVDVALVNRAFATLLQGEGGALGATLARAGGAAFAVVGVVDELAYPGASADTPRIYLPASPAGSNFIIKLRPGQSMSRQSLVTFVAGVSADLGVFLYDDLQQQRAALLLPRRLAAVAAVTVALIVMLVSALGLFGMVSYTARLRDTEIGVRRAFGAGASQIVWLLVRRNSGAVVAGVLASIVATALLRFGVPHWLDDLDFDLRWLDMLAAVGVLLIVALAACYLSARPLLRRSPTFAIGNHRS